MVSIVFVSHSQKVAAGVVELAAQMTHGKVLLAAAGGVDDPANPYGTDVMQIHRAIESVYSEDGVVVLMDLGSAILSAETALEFLPPDQQANIYLCPAPIVEGGIAAAVQAAAGSPATAVIQEAMAALIPKQTQLGLLAADEVASADEAWLAAAGEPLTLSLTVANKLGLHARPAARFVATAAQFQAFITVRKGQQTANAKSMNQIATLGARQGETLTIQAAGPDAAGAIAAIQALAENNFGDVEEAMVPETAVAAKKRPKTALGGIAASPGIALGPPHYYRPTIPEVTQTTVKDTAGERQRLQTAVAAVVAELGALERSTRSQLSAADAAIFQAHRLILQDPDLQKDAHTRISERQINAEAAWQQAITAVAGRYAAIDDPYMRTRAADVTDVGNRVLRQLMGVARPSLALAQPVILLADELTPSDTAQLDPDRVLGLITARGGATSHSAILARGLGIPAVAGVGGALAQLTAAKTVALDGQTGQVWANPTAKTKKALQKQRQAWLAARQEKQQTAAQPAVTTDGRRLEIAANIGRPQETAAAVRNGAEGVGLFRTEFLFMDRKQAPDEEEQLAAYQAAAAAMGDHPVIIRTLDIGGDKLLPYLNLDAEENPFLGWRGIRFCLDMPHLFKPQLRAILRAGHEHNLKLMFPMLGTLAEWQAAQKLLAEARAELRREKLPFAAKMETGVMVEVPSAVLIADQLAAEVDFFSIGTNDLTQYVMAADRGNARVAGLVDSLHPAVLRLIRQTAVAAHDAGIWVGMCGELAGNPLAVPLLIGLGLDELSMAAPAIPAVKAAVRQWSVTEAEAVAAKALTLASGTAVADHLTSVQK